MKIKLEPGDWPAFSRPPVVITAQSGLAEIVDAGEPGLTLREYYAGQVLVGMFTGRVWEAVVEEDYARVAKKCFDMGNAMAAAAAHWRGADD